MNSWLIRFLGFFIVWYNQRFLWRLLFARSARRISDKAKVEEIPIPVEILPLQYDAELEILRNLCLKYYNNGEAWKTLSTGNTKISLAGDVRRGDRVAPDFNSEELVAIIKLSKYDKRMLQQFTIESVTKHTNINYKLQSGRFPTANRDYVTISNTSIDQDKIILSSKSIDHPCSLPQKTVRAKLIFGCWIIDTKTSHVTYMVHVDPMGYIPNSLLQSALNQAPLVIDHVFDFYKEFGPPPFILRNSIPESIVGIKERILENHAYEAIITLPKEQCTFSIFIPRRHFPGKSGASLSCKFAGRDGGWSVTALFCEPLDSVECLAILSISCVVCKMIFKWLKPNDIAIASANRVFENEGEEDEDEFGVEVALDNIDSASSKSRHDVINLCVEGADAWLFNEQDMLLE